MAETVPRMSPYTGTELPRDRPFWIVDGRAYDLTEWMGLHPGGAIWFAQTEGRDISALLHTYHREPARLQKILAKYLIEELADQEVSARLVGPRSPESTNYCSGHKGGLFLKAQPIRELRPRGQRSK